MNMTAILPDVGCDETFLEKNDKPQKNKPRSPFDYVKSINSPTKKNLMLGDENDVLPEKDYNPWLVNLSFSYHIDTILYANEMNRFPFLEKRHQYNFFMSSIRPKKRYADWIKNIDDEDLQAICNHYSCNPNIGREYLSLLSSEQIDNIKKEQKVGGIEK